MNGPVSRTPDHDQYGRPWGQPLWAGGPILGGRNHRRWVMETVRTDAERERIHREPLIVDHSHDAGLRRRAALKYALATLTTGVESLAMVEAILDGDRDDVVRTIL